uniref:Uncharacterized protein n=1 Tax=Anopheles darlingi TaxID=43151 RepID=A0A2M4D5L4_ANODA
MVSPVFGACVSFFVSLVFFCSILFFFDIWGESPVCGAGVFIFFFFVVSTLSPHLYFRETTRLLFCGVLCFFVRGVFRVCSGFGLRL